MGDHTARDVYAVSKALATAVLNDAAGSFSSLTTEQKITALYLAKAYKTYEALYLLVAQGYEEDALALSRTIFEIAIHVMFLVEGECLSSQPDEVDKRIEQMRNHSIVAQVRHYKEVKELQADWTYPDRYDFSSYIRHIEGVFYFHDALAAYDSFEKKLKRDWWGDISFKQLVYRLSYRPREYLKHPGAYLGKRLAFLYHKMYSSQSLQIHSSSLSFDNYLKRGVDGSLGLHWKRDSSKASAYEVMRDATTA